MCPFGSGFFHLIFCLQIHCFVTWGYRMICCLQWEVSTAQICYNFPSHAPWGTRHSCVGSWSPASSWGQGLCCEAAEVLPCGHLHMLLPPQRLQAPRSQTEASLLLQTFLPSLPLSQGSAQRPSSSRTHNVHSLIESPHSHSKGIPSLWEWGGGWLLVSECWTYVLNPFISLRGTSVWNIGAREISRPYLLPPLSISISPSSYHLLPTTCAGLCWTWFFF